MGTLPGQILSELGEIAKQTGTEAAKVPSDVVGSALESLGGSSNTGQTRVSKSQPETHNPETPREKTPLETFQLTQDETLKRTIAREALKQLAGRYGGQPGPTVQERLAAAAQEEEEKKLEQIATAAQMAPLTAPRGKRRGDLFGIRGKQSSEVSRNVRQD